MAETNQTRAQLIIQPFSEHPLGALLKAALSGQLAPFHTFRAAIAFVKRSGVQHIRSELQEFLEQGGQAELVVGIDQSGSSWEGLTGLLEAVGENGKVWINKTSESYITFHPKVYMFESHDTALLIIGSGNLTEGGLYTNDEASLLYWLNLSNEADNALFEEIRAYLRKWGDSEEGNALLLTSGLLTDLVETGLVPSEERALHEDEASQTVKKQASLPIEKTANLFRRSITKRTAPRRRAVGRKPKQSTTHPEGAATLSPLRSDELTVGFVMTLQQTDVGMGQTSTGTSRRSPEIFIPLAARNFLPEFWGWPEKFVEDSSRPGKFDRVLVKMRIGGEVVEVNMMTWPVKHDFRLRSEKLRSAGEQGDILRIEIPMQMTNFDYYVEIIPQHASDFDTYLQLCNNPVRNSQKRWGYYY